MQQPDNPFPFGRYSPLISGGKGSEEPRGEAPREGIERAVLVGIILPHTTIDLRAPLAELAALAESAGVSVVDSMIQKRMGIGSALALGKGKVTELMERVVTAEANVVIFDNELTPRQIRALEKRIECKVIDRSELILDIFARRAKTREAQLQVELAQLQYTAPRLRGMWTHLERIAGAGGATAVGAVGGVGTRGPGERQIEIDRRLVRDRITHLKRQIERIDARKKRTVRSRDDEFTVSLVGYTNSGKSTLMNRLTSAGRFVADMLFATLDTKTVRWDLGDGHQVLLSDTVGFVRDLPHGLVASFRATLEEAIHANLLFHVVDASSPTAMQQIDAVSDVLDSLGCDHVRRITLLNKIDLIEGGVVAEVLARRHPDAIRISAVTGAGLDAVANAVAEAMNSEAVEVTVHVPHAEGKLLSELGRLADILARRYGSEGVEIDLRMDRSQLAQLLGRYAGLTVVAGDASGGEELPTLECE